MLKWLSSPLAAMIAVGLLIVVAIRSIIEFFRIGGVVGTPLTGEEVFYIEGALAAACAALVVLMLVGFGRHGWAVLVAMAAILSLLVWKIAGLP